MISCVRERRNKTKKNYIITVKCNSLIIINYHARIVQRGSDKLI
jgi:hypothetical protein